MIPFHDVQDRAKAAALAESIRLHGWQGAPLVAWGEYLITGTHRYAACRMLGIRDNEIPTIQLPAVFAEAGLNFDAEHDDWGSPTVDEVVFALMVTELPDEIKDKYGIDIS